jgi:hypothetical protein
MASKQNRTSVLLASRASLLAMASKQHNLPCVPISGRFDVLVPDFLVQSFMKVNPSNQGPI